jgi:hypothetical protein
MKGVIYFVLFLSMQPLFAESGAPVPTDFDAPGICFSSNTCGGFYYPNVSRDVCRKMLINGNYLEGSFQTSSGQCQSVNTDQSRD